MGAHALLSPSAAHRWLNCTAAPTMEATEPDIGSDFAAEGSLAHAYAAKTLKAALGLDTAKEDEEIASLGPRYDSGEMTEYVDDYVLTVFEKLESARRETRDARLLVEVRLDFGKHIPGSFGTADAIIIADGAMEVIDFKYGKGVRVSAIRNPQMMIYALGAYELHSFDYNIDTVRMTIVQPRIDNLSEYTVPVDELTRWAADELEPKAREAASGGHTKPGEWCQFCRCKHSCAALTDLAVSLATDPQTAEPGKVSKEAMETKVLPCIPVVKAWLSGIEDYALQQALSGVRYQGYKVVEGRSVRRIADPDKVIETLEGMGFGRDQLVRPTELRTITDLERLVGKKRFAETCAAYIDKPAGKPTLVPASDKRQEINTVESDFDGIE